VPPDALEITVQNGSLRVEGRRRQEERGAVLVRELPTGHFAREFHLSSTIDPQRISASLDQGLLRLHLPKTPAALPRRIPLQIPPP
jgi:HSP20 family molecular chaperone IbpA